MKKKIFKEAFAALNKSIHLEPDYLPSRLLRGKISVLFKQFNSAEKDFLEVIDMKPHSAVGYKNLGLLYLTAGQKEKAIQILKKANKLDPLDTKTSNALKYVQGKISGPIVWEIR